jgi:hypothetical protein
MKITPDDWYYLTTGLWLAAPFGTETRNHGLYFAGYQGLAQRPLLGDRGEFYSQDRTLKLRGRYAADFIY